MSTPFFLSFVKKNQIEDWSCLDSFISQYLASPKYPVDLSESDTQTQTIIDNLLFTFHLISGLQDLKVNVYLWKSNWQDSMKNRYFMSWRAVEWAQLFNKLSHFQIKFWCIFTWWNKLFNITFFIMIIKVIWVCGHDVR